MIVQWGNITLYVDNPYFFRGYIQGRDLYKRDCQIIPARRISLRISEVLRYACVPDGLGHYSLDEQAQGHVEEYLGVFLGYLSGALPDTSR